MNTSTPSLVGRSLVPTSDDPRWAQWAKPLVALARSGPIHARRDIVAFCLAHGASAAKAMNLLSWCELEGMLTPLGDGMFALTPEGLTFLGDYVLSAEDNRRAYVPPPSRQPWRPETRLTPLREGGRDGGGNRVTICRCACTGREVAIRTDNLRAGRTKSCGCLRYAARSQEVAA